ncbi:hypothetical protein QE152_g40576 [Popillia japonica]|uniref:Uncharacterized protein n=1 Tax=Popillia japonica TaxID=7064 RepID=A0AAW1HFR2_POPJA
MSENKRTLRILALARKTNDKHDESHSDTDVSSFDSDKDLYVPSSSEDVPYSNSSNDGIPNKKTRQACSVFD